MAPARMLGGIDRHAFTLPVDRLDVIGNDKPRALFAHVEPDPALMDLQGEIERIATRHGVPRDRRKFVPHVTLARLKGTAPHEVARFIHSRGGYHSAEFEVEGFDLLSSKASIGGGPYLTEARYRLESFEGLYDESDLEGEWAGEAAPPRISVPA